MSDPIVDTDDLGTYLNDSTINEGRAAMMIDLAQTECENVIGPLPATARAIVMRVAARGYVSTTQARSPQLAAAGSAFGSAPGGASGIYVTSKDEYDLMRIAQASAGVSAFTIKTGPGGSCTPDTEPRPSAFGPYYGYGDLGVGWNSSGSS